jgi:cytochrome P450
VTLFWACLLLAHAEGIQDWMAEELLDLDLTAEGVQTKLIRTRAVVNETFRLFPAAPMLAREPILPDRIGTLDLPRHALVMISPWVLHRHHSYWNDPGAFLPSRFLPDAPPPPRFAFMPFGAGPRICVGAQFATAEAILVLASLVRRFRFTMDESRPVMPTAIVTTQPDHAPLFYLTRRAG